MATRLRAQGSRLIDENGPSILFRVSPQAHRCQEVRDRLSAFADRYGILHDDLTAFMTAVGEAVANAVEHSGADEPIEVECRATGEHIVATVRDAGVGFRVKSRAEGAHDLPCTEAERGRGIIIMRRCSDIFAIESLPGRGTVVTVGRLLRSSPAAGRSSRQGRRAASA